MNHYGVHPDRGKKHNVIGKSLQELVIDHSIATEFDHKNAVLEPPNPGQCLGKCGGFLESFRVSVHLTSPH